jgi:tetratricopeptide (TPR) repeat protein
MTCTQKGYFQRLGWPIGLLLLIGSAPYPRMVPAMQGGEPKKSSSVSAGISKEELAREARLKTVMSEGRQAYQEHKYDEAISRFQEGLELTKSLDPKNAGNVLVMTTDDALAQIGSCNLQLHDLASAERTFKTLQEFRKQNLPFDSSVSGAFENLAVVEVMQNNFSGGEDYLKQGIAYIDECINHFKTADAYVSDDIVANNDRELKARLKMELGNVYSNDGKFEEALLAYEEGFQIADKFHAGPQSQTQIVSAAITVAKLANRDDELKVWQERSATLRVKKD